uniref:Uncharacterized protein n=1 Tax=Candidatus Kentrum sp. FM TaxID=2126340 RepID=A0A450VSM6_9GAMM|nr:MAG: hypothetical protein BECKFM1743A_GA0114220_100467 [Candidatus Kentron sp. FM]VFJ47544.1 MAG: hypothetical protein BECKFM1743C_GA0114222_100467 [Candidatus Kentron sp. FM]VFK07803.1 MAG: hypothetical protein BECKFM1743B_GA0114221_100515 [Candidatus Kentron sp. FM]
MRKSNSAWFVDPAWVGAIATLMGTIIAVILAVWGNPEGQESSVYERQLVSLNDIERSINALSAFVRDQKEKLKSSQVAVEALKEEHQKLKPVVEADRKVIDALFQLQAQRQQKSVWLDRALGFCIGIVSSMIGTLLVMRVRRKKN